MNRRPLRDIRGGRASKTQTIDAPVGGMNARDALDSMPSQDAILLRNWWPEEQRVTTRQGIVSHSDTGETAPIMTLAEYEFGGVNKLLAATNGKIIDVTTATPSELLTGQSTTANYWVVDSLGASQFWVNGEDAPQVFDGTSFSPTGITAAGITISDFTHVHAHASRVYFAVKDTQTFVYSASAGQVTGAFNTFDLGLTGSFGGSLYAITSITRDGGEGPEDFIVFLFESGDVAVYQGTDPSNAAEFQRVGVFKIGRPQSRRGVYQLDSDVVVITDRGFEPLSRIMPFGSVARADDMLSAKIQSAVLTEIVAAANPELWSVAEWSQGQMLVFNAPLAAGDIGRQFVQNINTGQWAEFDLTARSWCRMGSRFFVGDASGVVHEMRDDLASDNGAPIECAAQQAWTYLRDRARTKNVKMIRLVLLGRGTPEVRIGVGSDFGLAKLHTTAFVRRSSSVARFGVARFGVDRWAAAATPQPFTYPVAGHGYAIGLAFSVITSGERISWSSTAYTYEHGGLV